MTDAVAQRESTGTATLVENGAIAEIVLANGPLNLVTRPLLRQLNRLLADLAGRQDLRVVILHGGDARAFCAGSDIKEFGPIRHDASELKILFEDMVLRNLARLPMPTIAKIWRAGCIIRSQMLDTMAEAFGSGAASTNLLMAPDFVKLMQEAHPALRRVVALATEAGAPVPALSSALAYFDSYRQGRGTSNLIQAQRDFFGAHGFERIDEAGAFHGPWGQG